MSKSKCKCGVDILHMEKHVPMMHSIRAGKYEEKQIEILERIQEQGGRIKGTDVIAKDDQVHFVVYYDIDDHCPHQENKCNHD